MQAKQEESSSSGSSEREFSITIPASTFAQSASLAGMVAATKAKPAAPRRTTAPATKKSLVLESPAVEVKLEAPRVVDDENDTLLHDEREQRMFAQAFGDRQKQANLLIQAQKQFQEQQIAKVVQRSNQLQEMLGKTIIAAAGGLVLMGLIGYFIGSGALTGMFKAAKKEAEADE